MSLNVKVGVVGVVAALLVAFGLFGLGGSSTTVRDAQAAVSGVVTTTEHGIDPAPGTSNAQETCSAATTASGDVSTTTQPTASTLPFFTPVQVPYLGSVLFCVTTTSVTNLDRLTFDSNDFGTMDRFACSDDEENDDNDDRVAEWPDDACLNVAGSGTDLVIVDEDPNGDGISAGNDNDIDIIIFRFNCTQRGTGVISITQTTSQAPNSPISVRYVVVSCRGTPSTADIFVRPGTVEIVPARANTSHALVWVQIKDAEGNPVLSGLDVDFTTDRCSIEGGQFTTTTTQSASAVNSNFSVAWDLVRQLAVSAPSTYAAWETSTAASFPVDSTLAPGSKTDRVNVFDWLHTDTTVAAVLGRQSIAAAVLGCNTVDAPGTAPGTANISAVIEVTGALDIVKTITVTVIGPPAEGGLTVTATPSSVRCGEKATITATVKDAAGQSVSDHTRVEIVTNLGGVIGGTGAVAAFAGPVVPVSSTVAETFGGVATAFLITSEVHSGPYEVVVTTGGTTSEDASSGWSQNFGTSQSSGVVVVSGTPISGVSTNPAPIPHIPSILGGAFSTKPVTAQAQISCALPTPVPPTVAPTITAPRTGTGITPPSTGDAGLVGGSSSSSWLLYAIAGSAAALALAGLAALKAVRR